MAETRLERADRLRHRIPFWWWILYDALVAVVILLGAFGGRTWTLSVGFATLSVAVVIDSVEFWVKRPANRARLQQESREALLRDFAGYLGGERGLAFGDGEPINVEAGIAYYLHERGYE